jgi:hypothetical protein|tara:strand:- start:1286 stop:1441 length:156 start_codon:yes stop_codon:yes gene_type:complete
MQKTNKNADNKDLLPLTLQILDEFKQIEAVMDNGLDAELALELIKQTKKEK